MVVVQRRGKEVSRVPKGVRVQPALPKNRNYLVCNADHSTTTRFIVQTIAHVCVAIFTLLVFFVIFRDKTLNSYYIGKRPQNVTEEFQAANLAVLNNLCRNLKKWHTADPKNERIAALFHTTCDLSHIH